MRSLAADDRPARRRFLPVPRRTVVRTALFGAAAAAGAISIVSLVSSFSGALDAVGDLKVGFLVAAVVVEALSYALLGAQLRRLAGPDARLPRRSALRLALVVYGFGIVTPASPAEGLALGGSELRRRGLSTRRAALTLGFMEWYSAAALVGLAAVNVLAVAALGLLPDDLVVPLVGGAIVALVAVAGAGVALRRRSTAERLAVVLGGLAWWRPRPPVEDRRAVGAAWHDEAMQVAGSSGNRLTLLALSLATWLADALCLQLAMRAAGVSVPFPLLLLAYTVGVLATEVPLLPGGLGLVEAAIPLVLASFGVPVAAALAGTLAYRAIGTVLPAGAGALAVPGMLLARRAAPAGRRPEPALARVTAA